MTLGRVMVLFFGEFAICCGDTETCKKERDKLMRCPPLRVASSLVSARLPPPEERAFVGATPPVSRGNFPEPVPAITDYIPPIRTGLNTVITERRYVHMKTFYFWVRELSCTAANILRQSNRMINWFYPV